MRRATAWVTVLVCLLGLSGPARAADLFLLGFEGFDYEDPNPNTNSDPSIGYLDFMEGYRAVGFVTSANATFLTLDFTNDENTLYLGISPTDLIVVGRVYFAPFLILAFSDGRVQVWRDPVSGGASPATYGTAPSATTAPSTFSDGTEVLGGLVTNFTMTYDVTEEAGHWEGNVTWDEGTQLGNLQADQRAGWIMAGQLPPSPPPGRPGYHNQVSGECRIPESTPTTIKSWGSIKQLYR